MNARCVFVPIDDKMPRARLDKMVESLKLDHIITFRQSCFKDYNNVYCYEYDDILQLRSEQPVKYPTYKEDDDLYIYFTSGSTGVPKGVVGRNESLLQFLKWEISEFQIDKPYKFSQFISPYFDAFLRDIFIPLLTGGVICIPPKNASFFSPEEMVPWIDKTEINYIHCVPSVFRVFNKSDLNSINYKELKCVLLSGEKINPSELIKWYEIFGSRIQLVNLYGATETTMIRSFYRINPEDAKKQKIPIGKPIADTELLVANNNLEKCQPLVPGDLYIVTQYTSNGYLNNQELTSTKFLRWNTGTPNETTAYKTGDRARLMPDGSIDLMGREDKQVKINGIRVELEEIENVISKLDGVTSAVVLKVVDESLSEQLVAFLLISDGDEDDNEIKKKVLDSVHKHLPKYMLPSQLICLKEFPLLSNGKVNTKQLEELINTIQSPIINPTNEIEEVILGIWQEILGSKPISITDSFHSIGGNSLSIMRLIGRLYKEFGVRVGLNELFNNLTIEKQAKLIQKSTKDNLYVINKAEIKEYYNTSSAQENMYYNYQLDTSSSALNLPLAWKIGKDVDLTKIEDALNKIIDRHEAFRTSFKLENDKLVQKIEAQIRFEIEEIDATSISAKEALSSFIRPFDLSVAPLLRCAVIWLNKDSRLLVMDTHHIICDGMSQVILFSEFLQILNGQSLPPLSLQYKDFAEWEYNFRISQAYIASREFWLTQFEGEIPRLSLPVVQKENSSEVGRKEIFELEKDRLIPVLEMLKDEGVTPYSVLFSMFFMYISQLTGQDDIIIGSPSSGRTQHEIEGVLGMFVKTLPIRRQIELDLTFKEFVLASHKLLVKANSHQVYDLSDIVRDVNDARALISRDLFEVLFIFQNFQKSPISASNEDFKRYELDEGNVKHPLTLFANEGGDVYHFRFEYSTAFFTQADIQTIINQFKQLVFKIADDPEKKILEYLTEEAPSSHIEEEISFNL
ncbi:condensation domain-containing protein [Fulvivirga maritima]|uniref:condensation domain-containing protein n=1 Tax=Fulvivirga maritima TaxID=2904247 RepID=UPI001F44F564|nr:condensation domain-containing protein [Fulvivirga maritima]UII24654.1 condensation domain-containing protein [Fulvivirga maritima]